MCPLVLMLVQAWALLSGKPSAPRSVPPLAQLKAERSGHPSVCLLACLSVHWLVWRSVHQ